MVIIVWITSPLIIIAYIVTWIACTSSTWDTYTNLNIYTVCMGDYWLHHDHHTLVNFPTYFTGVMLLIFMLVIVISNLAVLKQLFRSRPAPMVSLQGAQHKTGRRNNTCSTAPQLLMGQNSMPRVDSETKEQLKRISRADMEMKKGDRIFQTDSSGDITGINITAIMKLYVNSTRSNKKVSNTKRPSVTNMRQSPVFSEELEVIPDIKSVEPTYPDRYTPNTSTICGSVIEEDEDIDEDEEEEEDDKEMLMDVDTSSLCLDEEEFVRSLSISPIEADSAEEDEEAQPDQAIWKVIKFIAALKRNSQKRRDHWTENSGADESEEGDGEDEDVPKRRVLQRSSSDSDLNYLQMTDNVELKSESANTFTKSRKYSEYSRNPQEPRKQSTKKFPYQPLTMDREVVSPTMDELDDMVNGGEFSPLAKRNSNYELASLISVISTLKKRSKEAKDRIGIQGLRNGSGSSPVLSDDLDYSDEDEEDGKYDIMDMEEDDSGCIEDYVKLDSPGEPRPQPTNWATLALVTKFKNKMLVGKRLSRSRTASAPHTQESVIDMEPEPELDQEIIDISCQVRGQDNRSRDDMSPNNHLSPNHTSPNHLSPFPPNLPLSNGGAAVQQQQQLVIYSREKTPCLHRKSLILNTITEEDCGVEESELQHLTADEEEDSFTLHMQPSMSTIASPGMHLQSKSQISEQSTGTPSLISPRMARSKRVSRSKSLESVTPQPAMPKRTRRGGFLIKPDDMMDQFSPSPANDMLSSAGSSVAGSRSSGLYMQNAASAFKRRMRASSVYRMGARNSINMASVAQMVYNFNKAARKKKKEIRAAKTIIILVFYYIITLLLYVVSFYYVTMRQATNSNTKKEEMSYWLTFYSYIIYLNAVFNPVIHFWRNARVRNTVMRICCPRQLNDTIRRWNLRGQRTFRCC